MPKFEDGGRLPEHASLGDEQIIVRVVAGETALFEELMRRYNQRVYRVARATSRTKARPRTCYNQTFNLRMTDGELNDLAEYLKSL